MLYGSGYVLIAWLEAEFVTARGWLDARTLLDAIAVGQVTPGPLFTTATFVGGITAGAWGALAATIGIFLPAFVFVAVSGTIERFVHARPSTRAFLGGVAVASLALMAKAAVTLGAGALGTVWAAVLAAVALGLLARTRIPSTALLAAGALLGLLAGGSSSPPPPPPPGRRQVQRVQRSMRPAARGGSPAIARNATPEKSA